MMRRLKLCYVSHKTGLKLQFCVKYFNPKAAVTKDTSDQEGFCSFLFHQSFILLSTLAHQSEKKRRLRPLEFTGDWTWELLSQVLTHSLCVFKVKLWTRWTGNVLQGVSALRASNFTLIFQISNPPGLNSWFIHQWTQADLLWTKTFNWDSTNPFFQF